MTDDLILQAIRQFGTPLYLYDKYDIVKNINQLKASLWPHVQLFYSIKANPLIEICKVVLEMGCGMEIASEGELNIALQSGCSPSRIIFSSPGKTIDEIALAIDKELAMINTESLEEIKHINRIAKSKGKIVSIAVRINPKLRLSKAKLRMTGMASQFGIDEEMLDDKFFSEIQKLKNIVLHGFQVYIGTQILDAEDIINNTNYILESTIKISSKYNIDLRYINFGGGFGIPYFKNETTLDINILKLKMNILYEEYKNKIKSTQCIFESGRYLVGNSGLYIVKILYIKFSKGQKYLICDGGSNFHASSAFLGRHIRNNFPMRVLGNTENNERMNIAGPLCTPTDIIGQSVILPSNVKIGDYLIIENSGAYGLTNSPLLFLGHKFPEEVLYDGTFRKK